MGRRSPNAGYVLEKMYGAIWSMCGRGSLGERLANATVGGLMSLEDDDLPPGELRDDLKCVLDWTKRNLSGDRDVKKLPDDLELHALIEKMLRVMLKTHTAD